MRKNNKDELKQNYQEYFKNQYFNNHIESPYNNNYNIYNINYYNNNSYEKNFKNYNFEKDFTNNYDKNYNNDINQCNNDFENSNKSFNNFIFQDYEENNKYFESDNNNIQYGDDDDGNEYELFKEGILINLKTNNTKNNTLSVLSSFMRSNQKINFNKTINKENLFGTMGLFKIENSNLFNPVLQCLSNIYPLTEYFLKDQHKYEINENNPLSSFGNITIAYAELLKIIWNEKLDISFKNNKVGFYLDNNINNRMKDVYCNLLNELGKKNCSLYKNNDGLYGFFNFFLWIIHEDLKRNLDENETITNNFNENNLEELYKNKWKNFKLINNSIITDIFFGMNLWETQCSLCHKKNYIFETFNIFPFSLNYKNLNIQQKKDNLIPSINNFYFIQCIILPFNIKERKKIVFYPLIKKIYDIIKIKDILKIISYIFDLKIDNLVPCILSDDFCSYKLICSGEEYLYEIFSNPTFVKIFFVVKEERPINLKKDFEDNMNLLKFFLNPKEINIFKKVDNTFLIGEEIMGDSIHVFNSTIKNNFGDINFKLNSFYYKNNNNINKNVLLQFKIPKMINFSFNLNLVEIYNKVLYNFNLEKNQYFFTFNNMISNLIDKKFDFEKEDIMNVLSNINKEQEKIVPFILCIKIERKSDIYINSLKDFYIPIPFITSITFSKFIKLLYENIFEKENLMNIYKVKKFRINVIWLEKFKKQIFDMENYYILKDLDEINPYKEITKNKNETTNKEKINIYSEIKLEKLIELISEKNKRNNSYCEYCNQLNEENKKFMFYSLPDVIIFYFKRTESDKYNNIKIKFPINNNLDLSPYTLDEISKLKKYELIGIINYDYKTNHYNCFCKNPLKKKWYLFDDTDCCPIYDIEKEIIYENVYCLIYKNIDFIKYHFI